jgi:hypothetical protein
MKTLSICLTVFLIATLDAQAKDITEMPLSSVQEECINSLLILDKVRRDGGKFHGDGRLYIRNIPVGLEVINTDPNQMPADELTKMYVGENYLYIDDHLPIAPFYASKETDHFAILSGWEIYQCTEKSITFLQKADEEYNRNRQDRTHVEGDITLEVNFISLGDRSGEIEVIEKIEKLQFVDSPHEPIYLKYPPSNVTIKRKVIWSEQPFNTIELPVETLGLMALARRKAMFDSAIVDRLNRWVPRGACVKKSPDAEKCEPLTEYFNFAIH